MTLEQAQTYGAGVANKSGSSVLVYRTTSGDHGVAFTLPGSTNVRVGERIYPTNSAVSFSGLAIAPAVAAKERLEYLRGELRAECLSYTELSELQGLAEFIEPGDVELLEAAGVPEFSDEPAGAGCPACGGDGVELGALGSLMHYTCRDCGIGFSAAVQR